MARNVFIAAMEPGSGKSVISLGFMEMLSARVQRVGFFRPVIQSAAEPDPQIELLRSRYRLDAPHDAMYGITDGDAQAAIAAGDHEEISKRVVAAYRALESDCEVVVCEGTDFTGSTASLDFDLNATLANDLGCPVLVVVRGGAAEETRGAVQGALEALEQRGCDLFGVVVDRVPPDRVAEVTEALATPGAQRPVYVLPEQPDLASPTVGEVASALDARVLAGAGEGLHRDVREVRVAAMGVGHFLADLVDGTLVLVPGDRPDILVACLASTQFADFPALAGVVLTAGYDVEPAVRRLLEGAPFPVLEVPDRTYAVATAVQSVPARITADNERKIATALGLFQSNVDQFELEERIAVERPARMTPVMFEYELIERAKRAKQHVVLPEGNDDRVLRAADILLRRDVVDLTVLGDPEEIRARGDALGLDLGGARLLDPLTSELRGPYAEHYQELRKHRGVTEELAFDTVGDVGYFGTLLVDAGEVDGMVSGAAHTTGDTIRPAFEIIRARPGVAVVSSVFFMCLADRVLVYGDCAVNPKPDVEQLADIAISSAETALSFGIEPRIAMLSYSTGESAKGEDVDRVREATRLVGERRHDLKVEGPIQYDAAVDATVAALKMPESEVAGQATVFIFPDLETGNIAYKAVQRSADAVAVGPVLQGLRKPVNDLSRGCTVTDIVNTVVITAIQSQEATGRSTSRLRVELPAA